MNQPDLSEYTFIFAHGAGADKDSDWMLTMDKLLAATGLSVNRFNFPYMNKSREDGKRRPPDRLPVLLEAFMEQIKLVSNQQKVVIGGKSMGGRIASLLACESELKARVSAVICLGFPFHPPGKNEKYRGAHLVDISLPTLIVQGERDTFGTRNEIDGYQLSKQVAVRFMNDGDHSFKPRIKSGFTLAQNLDSASLFISEFIHSL
ncbi:alpha/beta fold hydrolase [Aliikangiella sp. IMCC44359]|uniref:alpha/beta fold hydrolase n=1 Tax=Aliikangiella sp. IMCC44359 TaxID=3459125 RepID=UPI00403B2622